LSNWSDSCSPRASRALEIAVQVKQPDPLDARGRAKREQRCS
jgi:hypothetical protein